MAADHDLVPIASPELSATISPLGAELQSLKDADGRDLLWNGDPAFWGSRAPILFPIVGSVQSDEYRVDGTVYKLPRHGFARRRTFEIVAREAHSATFRLESDDETWAVYPFDFRLDIEFAITGARLDIAARLTNPSERPLSASFGYHPAFRWPLPYGAPRAAHTIRFEHEEPEPIRQLNATGQIEAAPRDNPLEGRTLALRDSLFEADALVFEGLKSHRVVYGAPGAPVLEVDFPRMPDLGIWTKPGAPFVCIEPWQGHSDPVGYRGEFRDKPGVVTLVPGETRVFAIAVTLRAAEPADFA